MEKDNKIRVCGTKPGISYGLAKVMAPKCTRIRSHQFTMKDSFGIRQTISQDSSFLLASLDVSYIFTNILLEEKI